MDPTVALLHTITAAVTPVVMISAVAALILGINSKHSSLGDRLRSLAGEYRDPATSEPRRESINRQAQLFRRRFQHTALAQIWLYGSVVCFIATVLTITLASRIAGLGRVALGSFVAGVVLTLGAVFVEFTEIRLGSKTIEIEIQEILVFKPDQIG